MNIHTDNAKNLRFSHYFNKKMTCPYSDLGCVLRHEESPVCHFKEKCLRKLCQFFFSVKKMFPGQMSLFESVLDVPRNLCTFKIRSKSSQ